MPFRIDPAQGVALAQKYDQLSLAMLAPARRRRRRIGTTDGERLGPPFDDAENGEEEHGPDPPDDEQAGTRREHDRREVQSSFHGQTLHRPAGAGSDAG